MKADLKQERRRLTEAMASNPLLSAAVTFSLRRRNKRAGGYTSPRSLGESSAVRSAGRNSPTDEDSDSSWSLPVCWAFDRVGQPIVSAAWEYPLVDGRHGRVGPPQG